MKWRKWLFWLPEEDANSGSAASARIETEACREWTPFLTALFDGEADEDGALRARRHLLVCERCARAWMDWNQTRSLLINHSAPPPPPSLLWRIRLACRLGNPEPKAVAGEPEVPQLAAQILARTTRQAPQPQPKPSFASWFFSPRGLRTNAPFLGAVAMGAFVLFVTRDSMLVSTPPEPLAQNPSRSLGRAPLGEERSDERNVASSRVARGVVRPKVRHSAPRIADERDTEGEENEPRFVAASSRRTNRVEPKSSLVLERARRERESLGASPIRLASFEVEADEPLRMLPAPPPLPAPVEVVAPQPKPQPRRQTARPPRLARLPRIAPRPVASSARIAAPVVLASFEETPTPTAAPGPTAAPRIRRPERALLAAAPLRISTPRALPIVVSQPSVSDVDDSGLDELDSTVQEYRAALSDDSSDFMSDAG